jgi:uncharacterized membrane protein YqjE
MIMEKNKETLSLSELFGNFASELRTMMSDELELAKAEMSKKISDTLKDALYVGVGGLLLLVGLLSLVATLIIILAYGLPLWLASLVVTIVVSGIGFLFLQRGLSDIRRRSLVPDQTLETLKEDKEWAKHKIT